MIRWGWGEGNIPQGNDGQEHRPTDHQRHGEKGRRPDLWFPRADWSVLREPNPDDDESPSLGLSLTNAPAALLGFRLDETTYIANSLPYAQALEEGHSKFKALEGIYAVAAEQVAQRLCQTSRHDDEAGVGDPPTEGYAVVIRLISWANRSR